MQTIVETTEKHTVRLTVEVPTDDVEKDLDRTYRKIANSIRIPGFRKGKAPKRVIDVQVGRDMVVEEYLEETVPAYYREAVREHDLAPIAEPDLDVEPFEDGKPLVFTATVEVRPRLEFTEEDYSGVQVSRPMVEVGEDEVDEYVDRLRQRFAELEPVSRPIQDEDFATIDLTTTLDGEAVEAATRPDYLYFVGGGEFGPVLDEELKGAKPGDILAFDAELPERFSEVGGRPASFRVLVKEVKTRVLPEADDSFATVASEFDTLVELREDLRSRLREAKEREADGVVRDRVLQAMIDRVEVDLPESLVEEETRHRVTHARERAERVGMTLDQLLETQGWDRARLEEDSREHAIRGITSDLVLEGVARAADIEVTADELGVEISALAQAYGRDPKEVAKQLDRSGQIVTLAGDIIRGKALDLLVERADITTETEPADDGSGHDESKE
jgi:trigger factor